MDIDIWTNWNGYEVDGYLYDDDDIDEIYNTSNFDYVEQYDYLYDYCFDLYFGVINENKDIDRINGTDLVQPEL